MQEALLRHYFSGEATVADLKADLAGSLRSDADGRETERIEDMPGHFQVTAGHLAALCDEVLQGHLSVDDLHAIGLCLAASEHFDWDAQGTDGARVGAAVVQWADPDAPLTEATVRDWRQRLLLGDEPHTR